MSFSQPWMLGFAAVALVPLVLHLIGRRRARQVSFTALAFLLSHDPKRARALRVEQRLLVALRMLAAAMVALALAQPWLPDWTSDTTVDLGHAPVAVVLVVDNSMSMGAEAGARFDAAHARALALLDRLPPGSRAAVVTSARPATARQPRLSADLRSVAADLRALRCGQSADDAARALSLARGLLAGAGERERRILVLTDLQASGWGAVAAQLAAEPRRVAAPPGAGAGGRPPIRTQVVTLGERVDDTELVSAEAEPATDRGPQQVRVQVRVRRHGTSPWRGQLTLRVGEREVRSWVQVPAGGETVHAFVVPALAPVGEVSLDGRDALPANDARPVRIAGSDALRVLVINGAPRPVPREDETFFFVRALQAGAARSGELRLEVRRPGALSAEGLQDWDVLVLANVPELSVAVQRAIAAHVSRGAGLLVTLGDSVPEPAGDWLASLLPVTLAGVARDAGQPLALAVADPHGQGASGGAGAVAASASVTALLRAALDTTGRVRARRRVRPAPQLATWTRLRYGDGGPALLVAPRGKGRVGLWTTSLDRDWSDLPLQPGWLPLARALVFSVIDARGVAERADVAVGATGLLRRGPDARRLRLRRGDQLVATLTSRDQALWRLPPLPQPGVYRADEDTPGGVTSRTVLVHPPAEESAPALLRGAAAQPSDPSAPAVARSRPLVPGWTAALVGLLLLLLGEATLLRRSA